MAEEGVVEQPQQQSPLDQMRAFVQKEERPTPPRGEGGKFTSAKPAAPQAEATPETEAPAEDAPAATEETSEETPQPLRFKLKVKSDEGSDEEIEVDEEELKRGYMKSKDYSVKTAQLAREREAVQAKVREAVEPKLKEYDDRLQVAEQVIMAALMPEFQGVDMDRLAIENPAEWAVKFQKLQNAQGKLAHIQAERQRLANEASQESQKSLQKSIREANEVLTTEIPGWNKDLYGKILETGKSYGFKQDEVNNIVDPRAIKVLHDAMKFRALQAKPVADKKKVDVPKVVRPGTAEKPDPKAEKWDKQMETLKKNPGARDAAFPLFLDMVRKEK